MKKYYAVYGDVNVELSVDKNYVPSEVCAMFSKKAGIEIKTFKIESTKIKNSISSIPPFFDKGVKP
jgi:hypothetical protein